MSNLETSFALNETQTAPSLSPDEARAFVSRFPVWYQNIHVGSGVYTVGTLSHHELVWSEFEKVLPKTLGGLSVLDVGCNAGYFALQAKLRSARHVVGAESVRLFLEQAREVSKIYNADIDYRHMDAHALRELNQIFDIVVFAGILYHLKNPFQVIEDLGRMCTDAILLETEIVPDDPRNCIVVNQGRPCELTPTNKGFMKFIEGSEVNGDATNWWVPDIECVKAMLRTAGFIHISRPVFYYNCRLLLVASKKEDSILNLDAFRRSF